MRREIKFSISLRMDVPIFVKDVLKGEPVPIFVKNVPREGPLITYRGFPNEYIDHDNGDRGFGSL